MFIPSHEATPIFAIHSDIIEAHILNRLGGPDLASISCVSSELCALSTQEKLWKDIATKTWPSINHPRIQHIISTFPSGYRSFFSDAFPFPSSSRSDPYMSSRKNNRHQWSDIFSAVDIQFKNNLIYSKIHETGLITGWVDCVPFRVSLLNEKETVPTCIPIFTGDDTIKSQLEDNLTLSWILIDPTRKRAVNLSSLGPVSVKRHWLTGDVQVKYATILTDGNSDGLTESVQCAMTVTCGWEEGEQMHVKEVVMQVEDMDGRMMNGEESKVILQGALESGRGKRNEEKEKYEHYLDIKLERKDKTHARERNYDIIGICIGITLAVAISLSILF